VLLRARHRHVEDAPLLVLGRALPLDLDLSQLRAVDRATAEVGQAQADAAVI
jgi:hypothetical protein